MIKTDYVGRKYGRLTVIGEVPINERTMPCRELICQCECGNKVHVRATNLTSGNTTSCGCYARETTLDRFLKCTVGKRYGRLTVLEETERNKRNKRRVICKCDCVKTVTVLAGDLLSGMTRSCGCLRKEIAKDNYTEDLTGQTFNELTAIRQVENQTGKRVKWLFKCSCGKEVEALPINVKRGFTKTCGHARKSKAESEIIEFLDKNNIQYKYNNRPFSDLVNPVTGRILEIDFVIPCQDGNSILIEHYGKQHFISQAKWEEFGKNQREITDKVKAEYCEAHGIKLYTTRFDEDYVGKVREILIENNLMTA